MKVSKKHGELFLPALSHFELQKLQKNNQKLHHLNTNASKQLLSERAMKHYISLTLRKDNGD